MATYFCSISGLKIQVSYLSCTGIGMEHPVFSVPSKKLVALLSQWEDNKTSPEETHLLFCALLKRTGQTIFDSPLTLTTKLSQFEEALMHPLAQLIFRGAFESKAVFPKICISSRNQQIGSCVTIWTEAYEEYCGERTRKDNESLHKVNLDRLQRALHNPIVRNRSRVISEWAAKVAEFPTFQITHPLTYKQTTLSEYWKELIAKAADPKLDLISYPMADYRELLVHLEENLPMDYGQEFNIIEIVRSAIQRKQENFGYTLEDFSVKDDKASQLADILQESAESLKTKPAPVRSEYSSLLLYMAAKAAWLKAQD